jgi:phosphoribosylformylglycinamidine synthase
MLPGGFSGGDEPDGSGKFIATTLRNPLVRDEVAALLEQRDGLILASATISGTDKNRWYPTGGLRTLSRPRRRLLLTPSAAMFHKWRIPV